MIVIQNEKSNVETVKSIWHMIMSLVTVKSTMNKENKITTVLYLRVGLMQKINTKYGTAVVTNGHYVISSSKEGNHGKYLHRLIFEDFYQIELPSDIIIHHDDGDSLNNKIWNLVPMTKGEHGVVHYKGKPRKCMQGENNPMYGKFGEEHPFYGETHTMENKLRLSKNQ